MKHKNFQLTLLLKVFSSEILAHGSNFDNSYQKSALIIYDINNYQEDLDIFALLFQTSYYKKSSNWFSIRYNSIRLFK